MKEEPVPAHLSKYNKERGTNAGTYEHFEAWGWEDNGEEEHQGHKPRVGAKSAILGDVYDRHDTEIFSFSDCA